MAEERDQIVERVAKAICSADTQDGGPVVGRAWDAIDEEERDRYRRMARAALVAAEE